MKTQTLSGKQFAAVLLSLCAAWLFSLFPGDAMAQEISETSPFSVHLAYPPPFDPDTASLPPVGVATGNERVRIPALGKETDGEDDWTMQFELRGSPVTETHGNAGRHDSLGGLVRGRFRF